MFGDIMGMMGKLKETQQKVEETKKRLDTVLLDEKSQDGLLEVTITANRNIKNISIQRKKFIRKPNIIIYDKARHKSSHPRKEGHPNGAR